LPAAGLLGKYPAYLRKPIPPIGIKNTGIGMTTLLTAVYQNAILAFFKAKATMKRN